MGDIDTSGWQLAEIREDLLTLRKTGDRIATALESLADTQRLHLKLLAVNAGAKIHDVKAALAEELTDEEVAEEAAAAPTNPRQPRSGADLIQLLSQSPDELDTLHRAHAHAEREYGRGQVPADLDLYAYAAEEGIDQENKPVIEEPVSTVPPRAVGPVE